MPERLYFTDSDAANALIATNPMALLIGFALDQQVKVKSLAAVLANRYGVEAAKPLVPSHPTLGDVDSAQKLLDYQAAKRAHKAEWMGQKRSRA